MKNEEKNFCQSCGMPLTAAEHLGTNADGSASTEYCAYCYRDGAFTSDETMDQMIEHCLEYLDEFNRDSDERLTPEQAREQMRQYFPTLKRWRQ
ncbi:MAG: zinc ribbon domain-containing protein [Rikenellaceae bacterium]|nr:zinc ribbon domain-containing protein [Rikenellaceae bacterium]